MRRAVRLAGWGLVALVAVIPLAGANTYYLYLIATIGVSVVIATGLNVLTGSSGQVSLGHAGLYAIGAYTGAILATGAGFGLWSSLGAAIAITGAVGALLALPALRVTGPYLAMVTIAFGIIVEHGLIEWQGLTRGFGGISDIPKPAVAGLTLSLPRYYFVIAGFALLSVVLARNLERSPCGRALVAVRESEIAAESLGLNPYAIRTVAFVLSAMFAGVGGCLYAFLAGFVSPDSFTFDVSILFLLIVIFGGLGRVAGPVVGSVVLILLPELLHQFADYRLILYGGLLLGSIAFLPQGVAGAFAGWLDRWRAPEPEGKEAPAAAPEAPAAAPLMARGVALAFGGVQALAGVDITVLPRTIHALIGPNGAGKTTLLNVLSGFYAPDAGRVTFHGRALHGLPAHQVARRGIARTFQTTQLFEGMTVLENVEVGLAGPRLGGLLPSLLRLPAVRVGETARRDEALALLRFVGYKGSVRDLTRNLSFGHRRLVEIARALATRPAVLLLDEPGAGLSQAEVEELGRLIARIRDAGTAVLLVGHHMELVMEVSEQVTVLHYGRAIAEGPPGEVQKDPAVLEAYLGTAAGGAGSGVGHGH